jgi:hypothetical protein
VGVLTEAQRRLLDENDHACSRPSAPTGGLASRSCTARDGERLPISTTKEEREMKIEDDERRAIVAASPAREPGAVEPDLKVQAR